MHLTTLQLFIWSSFFSGCPGLNASFEDNKKCLRNAISQGTVRLHREYYLLQIPLKAQYKKLNSIETYKMLCYNGSGQTCKLLLQI